MLKTTRALRLWLLLSAALIVLAACGGDDGEDDIPPPQPPTTEANAQFAPTDPPAEAAAQATPAPTDFAFEIVTRTPRPEGAPITPIPTVSFDVLPYEGMWNLILRYDISDGLYGDTFSYSSTAGLTITIGGVVFGTGTFQATVSDNECLYTPLNALPYEYTLSGTLVQASDGSISADLRINPIDAGYVEQYEVRCFDALDGRETVETLETTQLSTMLEAANQLRLNLPIALGGHTEEVTRDLNPNPDLAGQLSGEIYLGR